MVDYEDNIHPHSAPFPSMIVLFRIPHKLNWTIEIQLGFFVEN